MKLSLDPDESMRWIYDHRHPDYNTPRAKDLRERRRVAIQNAPNWMVRDAQLNDILRSTTTKTGRDE